LITSSATLLGQFSGLVVQSWLFIHKKLGILNHKSDRFDLVGIVPRSPISLVLLFNLGFSSIRNRRSKTTKAIVLIPGFFSCEVKQSLNKTNRNWGSD